MDELTREFLIESQEGLDRMERCLTELEERPEDAGLIGDIFRSVHTIKGTTGFLGFKRLEKLAHAGENLLGMVREGKLIADEPTTTGLLQLLDGLRSILKNIEAGESEGDGEDTALIARLEELQAPAHVAKAAHAQAVGRTAAASHERNSPQAAAESVTGREAKAASAASAQASADAATEHEPQPAHAKASAPAKTIQAESDGDAAKPRVAAGASAAESTLRVDVALLNRMMNLVGELVLTRNQVLQATAADPNLTLLSRRLDMVTADLRESVMKARMQPVSNIFSKMPRIVRDLSQLLGRKVRLQMEGQETELDKSLLEAIKDPLTHAVRNSLDHGIEPPDVRQSAGKDPEGTLRLRAMQEGSHVVIEVADDGAGIAVEKVRQKAVDRGLITAERAALLVDRELLQLVFLPGFSTAAAITNVSGRGVGMDVVRTNVEKIGGKVELDSRPGKGTTLRLRIPLTLAIIPALIVRSVQQSFALPQGALSELVHVPPEQAAGSIEWMEGAPLYRLRGKLLPLIFLERLLMPGDESKQSRDRDQFIAVLNADGRQFGLVVDGLADPEEIVVKPLSAVLKKIGLYSGATVLGNADLALILDPGAIASRAGVTMSGEEKSGRGVEAETEAEAAKSPEYLLVEVAGRQAAVPLADVLRIEQLAISRIEYIGYRPVLNFEGQLLPVEDSGGMLAAAASDAEKQIIVVVCRDGNRQVGIAVSQVLDVAAGAQLRGVSAGTAPVFPHPPPPRSQAITSRLTVLAVAVSTGGPAALDVLLPLFPADFPLPVLIVQHMPEEFTKVFAERLDARCKLRVREAAEGDPVRAGTIYIARGNWHMELLPAARSGFPPTLHLTQGPLENHCRPAADVLFRSVASAYGAGVLALVLTGMGSDGMLGCRVIRDHGGAVLAQDQATSTVWGMPGAVATAGLANRVLPLHEIAPEILRLVSRTHSEARELRESVGS